MLDCLLSDKGHCLIVYCLTRVTLLDCLLSSNKVTLLDCLLSDKGHPA